MLKWLPLGVCVLVLAACVAPGSSGDPVAPIVDSSAPLSSDSSAPSDPSAKPTFPECYGINESVEHDPFTIANLLQFTDRIVVAEVLALGPGEFNTSDGKNPGPGAKPRPGFEPGVITPVILAVDRAILGDVPRGELRVAVRGGTAGCVTHYVSSAPLLERNTSYVLFLNPSLDAEGKPHPELAVATAAFPIDEKGDVETLHDGTMSVNELATAVDELVAAEAQH